MKNFLAEDLKNDTYNLEVVNLYEKIKSNIFLKKYNWHYSLDYLNFYIIEAIESKDKDKRYEEIKTLINDHLFARGKILTYIENGYKSDTTFFYNFTSIFRCSSDFNSINFLDEVDIFKEVVKLKSKNFDVKIQKKIGKELSFCIDEKSKYKISFKELKNSLWNSNYHVSTRFNFEFKEI